MNSGFYTAVSGMRAQMDALDILSNNLANLNTAGFKEEKAFFSLLSQKMNAADLNALNVAVDRQKVVAESALNATSGSLILTHRNLDVALTGDGYLVVLAPQGTRYTRNGSLLVNSKSMLTTAEGFPVRGEQGPITLGPGDVNINENGEIFLDNIRVDRLKTVTFDKPSSLIKEGSSLLKSGPDQSQEKPSEAKIRQGFLEQSNVNPVSAVVSMVGILRQFEAMQKSVNVVMNDLNAKSIDRLGR